MRVAVFGSGYIGLVLAACLAEVGHQVQCIDIDQKKIDHLNAGGVPIYEPGLAELIATSRKAELIHFTTDAALGLQSADIIFIAVGTPPDEDGSADLQYVLKVAETIGRHLEKYTIIVSKSTVPVGTADLIKQKISSELNILGKQVDFDVVSNPEFLKEGAAIEDCRRPDRIIIGIDNPRPEKGMRELYAPYLRNHDRLMVMDVRSAELTKYAANAMLATKISFMNQMANMAEEMGADIEQVRLGIGADPRIGYHFIYPGCGYGGSCFGKDVQALIKSSQALGCDNSILKAVEHTNIEQKKRIFEKLAYHFGADLPHKTIAIWGLSFKPGTDDMRDAPSRVLMEQLWAIGAKIQAFDPQAHDEVRRIFGDRADLLLASSPKEALKQADALVVLTEWREFRCPNFEDIKSTLNTPVIFDGRNMYSPKILMEAGFSYYGIGRGQRVVKDKKVTAQKNKPLMNVEAV